MISGCASYTLLLSKQTDKAASGPRCLENRQHILPLLRSQQLWRAELSHRRRNIDRWIDVDGSWRHGHIIQLWQGL